MIHVSSTSIDSILSREVIPPPDVLKIDVEGAELEVLVAAQRLRHTLRPLILAEVSDGVAAGIETLLHQWDYQLFDGAVPLDLGKPVEHVHWNTIAIPRERIVAGKLISPVRAMCGSGL
jgi:hypothetical protein